MTIVVGYLPAKGGRASLDLAALLARSGYHESVAVVTVIPKHWATPSMAKVDAEFAAWAHEQGNAALGEARAYLESRWPDVEATFHRVEGRSLPSALTRACEDLAGELLVLGSSSDGHIGQVVVGSTAGRLLHSSTVPIAVAPRGYRTPKDVTVSRVSCAFSGTQESRDLLTATAQICLRVGCELRIVTFGVRGRNMYPPRVGPTAEDLVLTQWKDQVSADQAEALAQLAAQSLLPDGTTAEFVSGGTWVEAMDELDWRPGEVLVVGSSPAGALARVFLGSGAAKIVRASPVPIVAVPGSVAAEAAEAAEAADAGTEAG